MSGSRGGQSTLVTEMVLGRWEGRDQLNVTAPAGLLAMASDEPQRAFPAIAKDPESCAQIKEAVDSVFTRHVLRNLDSRELALEDESIDLVLTSPPYWTLKKYNHHERQLGDVADYDDFLTTLTKSGAGPTGHSSRAVAS